jgi:hypothetical protein
MTVRRLEDVACVAALGSLVELALDGNPVCSAAGPHYRQFFVRNAPSLSLLDLKPINDDEREQIPLYKYKYYHDIAYSIDLVLLKL